MEERGRNIHTLLLLLAHDSSSILLGLLELRSGQGILGFLIGKKRHNNQRPSLGVCRKSQALFIDQQPTEAAAFFWALARSVSRWLPRVMVGSLVAG